MRVHAEITPEDIAKGVRCDEANCPGALAIRRALGPIRWLSVMPMSGVRISTPDGRKMKATCPESLREFIRDFDNVDKSNRPVEPISFDLEFAEILPEG